MNATTLHVPGEQPVGLVRATVFATAGLASARKGGLVLRATVPRLHEPVKLQMTVTISYVQDMGPACAVTANVIPSSRLEKSTWGTFVKNAR